MPSSIAAHSAPVSAIGSAATRTVVISIGSASPLALGLAAGGAAESVQPAMASAATAIRPSAASLFFIEQASLDIVGIANEAGEDCPRRRCAEGAAQRCVD